MHTHARRAAAHADDRSRRTVARTRARDDGTPGQRLRDATAGQRCCSSKFPLHLRRARPEEETCPHPLHLRPHLKFQPPLPTQSMSLQSS
jgi:hypothetical protein